MNRSFGVILGVGLLAVLLAPSAHADVLVAPGAQASFWTLSAEPIGATETLGSNPFRFFNAAYFPDTASAGWVSMAATGNASATGNYTYDLQVNLTGFNPATTVISGTFGTDNDGSILLNGGAPVATTGFASFGTPTPFTFNSGFIPGINTITVIVNNASNPAAFFVQFSSTSGPVVHNTGVSAGVGVPTTPIPPTIFLTLGGLALVGFYFGFRGRFTARTATAQ